MNELPRGTVAFLMTDIEGSTRLVRDLGPAFPALLGDHFRLLGGAIEEAGGTLVSSEGDSVFAVFPSARQAVLAAVNGQLALEAHAWPGQANVRVRMGINAGEAVLGGRDYTGIEVHRTARIMAAGHGGQILMSAAARALAGEVGDGIVLLDAGQHRLRDMPASERLFQVAASGLAADFPPLRTMDSATAPTNLPTPPTHFVGRMPELAAVRALLTETRVLTLTGPGGTGKTRLAIEAGRASAAAYPDGVWFVGLDVIRDPALVLPAVAAVLSLRESPGRSVAAQIADHLATSRALLILDNLEQVIGVAPEIAALVAATASLAVLGTSREPLAIGGERVFGVPPLALPDEPGSPTAASLAGNDCVALFVERARAARATFALTDANASAVAAICRRLDGLPLALELAAARINVLSAEQILARMDHRLTLLASSRRDLTDRQRTLRGAIEWSMDLLAEPERIFFRRFGIFAGGTDFEAAQDVIDPTFELGDALDLGSSLVDRSLLRSAETPVGNRLEMLETIREFAADQLAAAAEERLAVGRRHAAWFADVAEASRGVLTRPDRDAALGRLERELPNFRAAMTFSREQGDMATALRIATGLISFWNARNHLEEGRATLVGLIDTPGADNAGPLAVLAVLNAAELSSWLADYAVAAGLARRGLAMAQQSGVPQLLAYAENAVGWSTQSFDPATARGHFERSLAIARDLDDVGLTSGVLQGLGLTLIALRDYPGAAVVVEESIIRSAAAGDRFTSLFGLVMRGVIRARLGEEDAGLRDHRIALDDAQAIGSLVGIALTVEATAFDAGEADDFRSAAVLGSGALRVRAEAGGGPSITSAGFPVPGDVAADHLGQAEAALLAEEGAALTTDELMNRARDWLARRLGETASA